MKKITLILLSITALVVVIFAFGGCNDEAVRETSYFTVAYMHNGKTVHTEKVKENSSAEGFELGDGELYKFDYWDLNGERYDFKRPVKRNLILTAHMSAKTFSVRFKADGKTVDTATYTIENKKIEEPAIPEKRGYSGEWENYTLSGGNIIVNAVYTPIIYQVIFYTIGGKEVATFERYTIEDKIELPEVPYVYGYTGEWGKITVDGNTVEVKPEYVLTDYELNFYADGIFVDTRICTIYDLNIETPEIPEKEYYSSEWEEIKLKSNPVSVNAVYTPINYSAEFYADGILIDSVEYNVLTEQIENPAVPEKEFFTGAWENYVLTGGGLIINAEYTPDTFTVNFVADGNLYASRTYNVLDISIDEPDVPQKDGCAALWSPYNLTCENITVNAVYLDDPEGTYGILYSVSEEGYTVTGYNGTEKSIYIPSIYNGQPVTRIADRAFAENGTIEHIVIGDNVHTIGESAFFCCIELKSVRLPNSVKYLGSNAFQACAMLETLNLPDGLESIEPYTFQSCGLTHITLPLHLKIIKKFAFYHCENLEDIIIPDNTLEIETYAFAGCKNLTTVTLGKSLQKIECNPFYDCPSLKIAYVRDPEGWFVSADENATSGNDLSPYFKTTPEQAARALANYSEKYFLKLRS